MSVVKTVLMGIIAKSKSKHLTTVLIAHVSPPVKRNVFEGKLIRTLTWLDGALLVLVLRWTER